MEDIDADDIVLLKKLNSQLKKCCIELCRNIQEDAENRIVLLEYFKTHDIDDKMSFDNKVLALHKNTNDESVIASCKDAVALKSNIRIKTIQKNQIEEEIKSVKKTMDVRPN